MSRFKQYLFFGSVLFVFQTETVRGILDSGYLFAVIVGVVVLSLLVALVATIQIKRRHGGKNEVSKRQDFL